MQNNLSLTEENMPESEADASYDYALIEINKKIYAIKAKDILEIIKIIELDYLSELPSCILGILRYDKMPTAVIDLREVLKQKRIVYNLASKIVVVKLENGVCGFICDRIIDIKKIKDKKIRSVPYQNETPFYDGIYTKGEENIYILNPHNISNYINGNKYKYIRSYHDSSYIVDDEESKKILKERKEFLLNVTREIQTVTPLYDRGVSFIINQVKYYINMASVKEFYKANNSKFIKIPNTPDYILGLVNIKGEYITIIDIRLLYNNSKTILKEKSTIIILNTPEYKIGILADEICESMDIDYEEIVQNRLKNQEEGKMNEFVKDGEIYQIVDTEKLLKDERLTIC